jgi:hypothetical protein
MPKPQQSPEDKQRSTESFGQGQSGYTAGRVEADPALQHQSRNVGHADGRDAHPHQLDTDDRFSGAGGTPWVPEEREEREDREDRHDHDEQAKGVQRARRGQDVERTERTERADREARLPGPQKKHP